MLILKKIVFGIGRALYCFFLAGILVEIFVRYTYPPLQTVEIEDHGRIENASMIGVSSNDLFQITDRGQRLRPNTKATIRNHSLSHRNIVIETNHLGFRGPELGKKTKPRVLFLGDSVTMADYVPESETYVRQVESFVRNAGREIETINAGIGSTGIDNYLRVLEDSIQEAQPDEVVVGLYLNDFDRSPAFRPFQLPEFFLKSAFLTRLSYALSFHWYRLTHNFDSQTTLSRETIFYLQNHFEELEPQLHNETERREILSQILKAPWDWGGAWNPNNLDTIKTYLGQIVDLCVQHRCAVRVVLLPVAQQVYSSSVFDYPQRQLLSWLAQRNIASIDPLPGLRAEYQASGNSKPLFYDQCHYTDWGNEVLAKLIWNRMQF